MSFHDPGPQIASVRPVGLLEDQIAMTEDSNFVAETLQEVAATDGSEVTERSHSGEPLVMIDTSSASAADSLLNMLNVAVVAAAAVSLNETWPEGCNTSTGEAISVAQEVQEFVGPNEICFKASEGDAMATMPIDACRQSVEMAPICPPEIVEIVDDVPQTASAIAVPPGAAVASSDPMCRQLSGNSIDEAAQLSGQHGEAHQEESSLSETNSHLLPRCNSADGGEKTGGFIEAVQPIGELSSSEREGLIVYEDLEDFPVSKETPSQLADAGEQRISKPEPLPVAVTTAAQTVSQPKRLVPQSSKNPSQNQSDTSQQSAKTSTGRFFTSKLNTGSLWSLLSVGSNHSEAAQSDLGTSGDQFEHQDSASSKTKTTTTTTITQNQTNNESQQSVSGVSKSTSFFSRVQLKCNQLTSLAHETSYQQQQHNQNSAHNQQHQSHRPNSGSLAPETGHPSSSVTATGSGGGMAGSKRFRFQVKYIGSSMLHKNFTLPMLEWIAKDVKRQTIRGAQSTSQRQFTIPVREIILEIACYQLTGISCKDGNRIFVHPMHLVSKYAQLQHDQTCFSYLIRDNKDSPHFCHVFQAKSATKVHDLFQAIREVTTLAVQRQLAARQVALDSAGSNQVRKSTSLGGQPKSMFGSSFDSAAGTPVGSFPTANATPRFNPITTSSVGSVGGQQQPKLVADQKQQNQEQQLVNHHNSVGVRVISQKSFDITSSRDQVSERVAAMGGGEPLQFDNSYQFEVMLVKKVKLQCRRVPASFVDDALETLKSFDVLKCGDSKSGHMKGVGKRIINASLDERQEYDEPACQQPQQQQPEIVTHSQSSTNEPPKDGSKSDGSLLFLADRKWECLSGSGSSSDLRRNSSSCLDKENTADCGGRESRSCQQSPTKFPVTGERSQDGQEELQKEQSTHLGQNQQGCLVPPAVEAIKKHQSMDSLTNIAGAIEWAKRGQTPAFANDFSPYNTISSKHLNERIAAIPAVSSSISLDHETKQRLARQVRETIMATAATIKKGAHESGDKLKVACKALDSLSCGSVVDVTEDQQDRPDLSVCGEIDGLASTDVGKTLPVPITKNKPDFVSDFDWSDGAAGELRRSSSGDQRQTTSNFDLFRRASARHVVKNRTMLLLIGKDELCTISIDKHQMLFSKSFSCIVHCLQGATNKDHFGIICRNSTKIQPNADSYAGLIFKCQSERVVREIMAALRQVINISHHGYHGLNSPYNPIYALNQKQSALGVANSSSLAAKRGFLAGSLELEEASRLSSGQQQHNQVISNKQNAGTSGTRTAPVQLLSPSSVLPQLGPAGSGSSSRIQSANTSIRANPSAAPTIVPQKPKNLIRSMFCDDCPLHWFHRLCCDTESLSPVDIKAIILRRIDSSLNNREQDELYSRFSEFSIDSVEEHNEIFMSLLRHLCERKQTKHNQTAAHLAALASSSAALQRQQLDEADRKRISQIQKGQIGPVTSSSRTVGSTDSPAAITSSSLSSSNQLSTQSARSHHRSGSSGGSLTQLNTGTQTVGPQIGQANQLSLDNFKRAKNSISVSIENILKRRNSARDTDSLDPVEPEAEIPQQQQQTHSVSSTDGLINNQPEEGQHNLQPQQHQSNLRRSQSTTEYNPGSTSIRQLPSQQQASMFGHSVASWRDSLSRTLNDDLATPFVGLFRRRSSTLGSRLRDNSPTGELTVGSPPVHIMRQIGVSTTETKNSLEQPQMVRSIKNLSPSSTPARDSSVGGAGGGGGGGSPEFSVLSKASFWKKSIFDKIRQPVGEGGSEEQSRPASVCESSGDQQQPTNDATKTSQQQETGTRRTREQLRALWKKAIIEQITLIKMEKQNQGLMMANQEAGSMERFQGDLQRMKLNYLDVRYARHTPAAWDRLLKQDPTKKVAFPAVSRLVGQGIPKQRRGEIWMFLTNQYQLRHGISFQPADADFRGDANQAYRTLLSQLSVQQQEIFVDIGRTFPTHPYYSRYLSIGQLSLFNLLKAYSLLDPAVGYCQGLSFVAGILLLHVDSEDEAFELMRHLLFNFGLRKQYLPSMNALHLQLYQITRLLRDHHYDLFDHFDRNDISPSLYAAPWFLTLFASQFPLGFVARLLDLIFLIGIEAIFRVSLNLLAYHRNGILGCLSLESTMDYMRSQLTNIGDSDMATIFEKSMSLDLRNKLIEYEIEYTFYCAEDEAKTAAAAIGKAEVAPNHKPSLNSPLQVVGDRSVFKTKTNYPAKQATINTSKSSAEPSRNHDIKHESQVEEQQQQDALEDSDHDQSQPHSKSRNDLKTEIECNTSVMADATATAIIQHLLANNHLKSLTSNYSY